ncbi:hypothetical protein HPB51_019326 [Rhipicephalus microplus]|uniref:Uncharacterized protein n=1 Tax=Rhipicephalus microplus TaxID=6941 RepID=A0A9J6DBM9_RHIMP|nr:hypothetical protein HPB51_019326 [Rhipicephalus microplus]
MRPPQPGFDPANSGSAVECPGHYITVAGKEQTLKHPGSPPKLEKEARRAEDQGIANLEQAGGSRRDGGRCGMLDKNEYTGQVSVNNQPMKRAKEEPSTSLPTSNDGSFDLLSGEARSLVFLGVSWPLGAKPGPLESVSLSFKELDDAVIKQGDGSLKAKANRLLVPLKAKLRVLKMKPKQESHHTSQANSTSVSARIFLQSRERARRKVQAIARNATAGIQAIRGEGSKTLQ